MSDSIHPLSPAIGPNLPELEADLDSPSTLPSLLPYETWAASCPEYNRDIEIYGRIVELHAKKCAFCAKEIRLGSGGDGALVQHMLSNQCRAIQWELEKEILGIAETDEDEMAFDLASILVPDDPPNIASHVSNISNTEMPSQTRCQGAGMTVSTSLWANYPWHLHDLDHSASPPFTICSIDPTGTIIRIRSNACASIVSQPSQQSCGPCARQLKSLELKQIFKRVTSGTCDNGLNLRYCSHKQLAKHVETKEKTIKKYRLQGIQANRDTRRLIGKLNDQKQFMLAIAASDDDGVGGLVRVALNQGASAAAIVDRLRQAQEGLYDCRSYTKKSLDMALLSLRLAGPRMLYALSKASNFPSLSTVYRNGERTYLRPSIAFPTADEVLSNIKSVCGKASKSCMRGFTLMIDEIALEERPQYSYAEDAIVGICREHANKYDTCKMTGRPISHLMELKKLLDSGECHQAKEATLVALGPFGQLDYTPMVVLISGTCKTELVDKQRDLIMLVLKAWAMSPWGQLLLGLIWSIATDGDGRRRQALHYICMSQTLHPSSPIYPELSQLALLNLCCGEGEVTHDGDFKHEEKRLASALRSNAGIFVNGTHITPQIIKRHLRRCHDSARGQLRIYPWLKEE